MGVPDETSAIIADEVFSMMAAPREPQSFESLLSLKGRAPWSPGAAGASEKRSCGGLQKPVPV